MLLAIIKVITIRLTDVTVLWITKECDTRENFSFFYMIKTTACAWDAVTYLANLKQRHLE